MEGKEEKEGYLRSSNSLFVKLLKSEDIGSVGGRD
jgi:hypothetical protein